MKKLSVEQKAKAYDEALERAKGVIEQNPLMEYLKKGIEYIFPELKESEDVKIRKSLLDYLYTLPNHFSHNGSLVIDWIAWLEKQGQTFTKKDVDDAYLKGISDTKNELEKQGEQNPTNTIEPKFKVEKGKWYVCIKDLLDNYANKVFRKGDIYLSTQDGSLIPSNSNVPYEVICFDTYFRDWTIQDAKSGDVLVSESECGLNTWYCIFKSLDDDENMTVYCYLARDGRFQTMEELCSNKDPRNVKPATKEQRDTLMKAMADAGYTFDFEKKELKKIEQKPDWSEEDERVIDDAVYYLEQYNSSKTIQGDFNKQYVSVVIDKLKSLRPQPKQEWSEEDKAKIVKLKSFIAQCNGFNKENRNKAFDLIDSIKPQNKWKPSDEQIKALSYYLKNDVDNEGVFGKQLVKLYQDLLKLREE